MPGSSGSRPCCSQGLLKGVCSLKVPARVRRGTSAEHPGERRGGDSRGDAEVERETVERERETGVAWRGRMPGSGPVLPSTAAPAGHGPAGEGLTVWKCREGKRVDSVPAIR